MKNREKTLVILKPDAVQRSLIGEIISRFEKVGLKIVSMKMVSADPKNVERHYLADPNWKTITGEKILENKKKQGENVDGKSPEEAGQEILDRLIKYMTAGPVVVLILEGGDAVKLTRKIVGGTEPLTSDVGTIRGDFVLDSYSMADGDSRSVRNLIHASSSTDDAEVEMGVWTTEEERVVYQTVHEKILYDVNFDNEVE